MCYCRLLAVVEGRLIRRLNGCMLDENVDINDFCSSVLVFIYPSIAIEREIHDKVLRSAEISEPCPPRFCLTREVPQM